jgi:hypothetical protein
MTPAEHQAVVDIARLSCHEYFDHYLTDVFPKQIDRMFDGHNHDVEAHPIQFTTFTKAKRRVDRILWMVAGGSVVVGSVGTLVADHFWAILKVIF